MKTIEEFQVGKNNIGYISSLFFSHVPEYFEKVTEVRWSTTILSRTMTDTQIESELKPGTCTLGDVLAVIKSEDASFKDGYANIFYFPSCVVGVNWGGVEWGVVDWGRGGGAWGAGSRVFSPASGRSDTVSSGPTDLSLESLDARLKKIEGLINPELLKGTIRITTLG